MEEHKEYEDYLARLKGRSVPFDDKEMFCRINARINKRPRLTGLILAFAFIALSIGLLTYFNADSFLPGGNGIFSEYIFQPKDVSADPIMAYVLIDQ